MKQTAVEWLIEQIEQDDSKIARVVGLKKYNSIVKQAKEMEKEQIIEAHIHGGEPDWDGIEEQAEQYYNETYKVKCNDSSFLNQFIKSQKM